jgi:uncharacterized protein (DUF305 family)
LIDIVMWFRRLLPALAATLLAMASVVGASTAARADIPAPEKQIAKYEVDFMTDMIDHHQMAIMMSRMCMEKAVHP